MREIWFMSGTKTAPKFVPVHEMKWDASLLSVLPASHAVLGCDTVKIVSEYDQEIPQSQTADNPVAPRGRTAQPSRDTRATN